MEVQEKGYWIYSITAVIVGMSLFAFIGYLICDLIIKSADTNNTLLQALITLIITVFIGVYFSKWLELRNTKKIELYKIQTNISLVLIDLASEYARNIKNDDIKSLLINESIKVKLYVPDSVLKALNNFINTSKENIVGNYNLLTEELRKNIK